MEKTRRWTLPVALALGFASVGTPGGFGDFLRKELGSTKRSRASRAASPAKAASNPGDVQYPIQIDRLPTDLTSFLALRDRLATTPQGGAAMFLLAAHLYAKDQELGNQAFAITLHQKMLDKTGSGYKGWEPAKSFREWVQRIKKQPYGPASYFVGATPANGYTVPPAPYRFDAFENPHSRGPDGSVRIFFRTSGADFPRPYTMSQNSSGVWKVAGGEGNIYLGVKPPTGTPDGTPLGDGDDL